MSLLIFSPSNLFECVQSIFDVFQVMLQLSNSHQLYPMDWMGIGVVLSLGRKTTCICNQISPQQVKSSIIVFISFRVLFFWYHLHCNFPLHLFYLFYFCLKMLHTALTGAVNASSYAKNVCNTKQRISIHKTALPLDVDGWLG